MFFKTTWSFLFSASSVQEECSALSVLAFPLILCVFRGGRRFLRLEVRFQRLELSITCTSNLQPLKSNI
ncbi:hypothetical protein PG294_02405 [Riemerella anatipestifer]|uniref:hypothetical protein n=1 Tax=Riemerella anatipestifer TaxID=34085 RepID=UPI000A4F50AF|nr:hypothetical protein [Riemerella anatipestifer]MCQ4154394.1 hypothetical protein [Riemerella anatipestifer]MDR7783012.1 hypothetical protein [Riemerella anatipestifer]MDY3346156.1 hypothetical protein [Riemerella anatipestifer]MDY3348505.1 hypothetical protein [Riemerella anatipestifer]MDY3396614.1 hypothetical protein [Riemerella anatipestifer]